MSMIGLIAIVFLALYGLLLIWMATYLGLPLIKEKLKRRRGNK